MSTQNLNPKAILILDDIKVRTLKWEKDYDPNDELKIISIEEQTNLPYTFESNPTQGQIYIQHPFNENLYLSPDFDKHETQRLKLDNISHLCGILGAKSFNSTLINKKSSLKIKEGKLEFSGPATSGQFEIKDEKGNILTHYYEIYDEYDGGLPADYDEAYQFAKTTGLIKDKSILQLIEKRNPKYQNKLKKRKIEVNLSEEITKSLEIGLSFKGLAGKLNINANFNSKEINLDIIELEIQIEF